ncbi:MAG TPA: DnaJ domain-containing protein [Candidatus Glassbacteria bacterium]|nr:DnaJ domain-containing protein [Candidatus Glassbacteria bacterium]
MLRKEACEVLGVQEADDQGVVKKAFKKKAAQLHPDKNPGDPKAEVEFKKINEAHRILTGQQKSDDPVSFGRTYGNDIFNDFKFNFNDIFNNGFRRTYSQPTFNIELIKLQKQIDFKDCVLGSEYSLNYNIKVFCPECDGGAKNKTICSECKGEGAFHSVERGFNFSSVHTTGCSKCNGTGKINGTCLKCSSLGYAVFDKNIKLKIPPIGDKRVSLKLSGAGNLYKIQGREINGDVVVDLIPTTVNNNMKIIGHNVQSKEKVKLDTLLFGGKIQVSVVGGEPQTLEIPQRTPLGTILILRNFGVKQKTNRGNHLVELDIEYPVKLTDELKEAIKKAYED